MKETEITIKVRLDSNNIPEEIYWSAPDGGIKDEKSKAILLSFWDSFFAFGFKTKSLSR